MFQLFLLTQLFHLEEGDIILQVPSMSKEVQPADIKPIYSCAKVFKPKQEQTWLLGVSTHPPHPKTMRDLEQDDSLFIYLLLH